MAAAEIWKAMGRPESALAVKPPAPRQPRQGAATEAEVRQPPSEADVKRAEKLMEPVRQAAQRQRSPKAAAPKRG